MHAQWTTRANLLTLIRLLAIAPMVLALLNQLWLVAAALFTVAVVTDIYDGKVARQYGETSAFGGLFDHGTDALFVTSGLWALAHTHFINPYLPWLVPLAFLQYVLDSKALAGAQLRTSRLGKFNGVAYYVIVGAVIGAMLLRFEWLLPAIGWAAWLFTATTVASMGERLITLIKLRQGPL